MLESLSLSWVFRKLGGVQAADAWEKEIQDTAKLAEREGWHSVVQWHRKFGYTKAPDPAPAQHSTATPESSWLSGSLLSECLRFDRLLFRGWSIRMGDALGGVVEYGF